MGTRLFQAPPAAKKGRGRPPAKSKKADDSEEDEDEEDGDEDGSDFDPGSEEDSSKKRVMFPMKIIFHRRY